MDIRKAQRRERKHRHRTSGMQVDGRSIFILEEEKRKKAEWQKRREEKESALNGEV